MPAYVVRIKGTKRLFGLYAVEREDDLFYLLDEETDPFDYEFAIVSSGYGIQFRKGEWPIKLKIGSGGDTLHHALSGADNVYLTEALSLALTVPGLLTWRRFPADLFPRVFRK